MGFIVIVNHYTDLMKQSLGDGFKYFLFSPLFGEDFQFDWYFSDGLKPPTSYLQLVGKGPSCRFHSTHLKNFRGLSGTGGDVGSKVANESV